MAIGADVREINGLRDWLASAAVFKVESEESLASIQLEIRRGIDWVSQQLDRWQRSIRDHEDAVVQAKAELSARRFPGPTGRMPDTTVQERNLRRAIARLEHAQDRVAACKKWLVNLPKIIDETFSGAGHRFALLLEGDVAKGLALLQRQIEALEQYAETRADFAPTPSASALPGTL